MKHQTLYNESAQKEMQFPPNYIKNSEEVSANTSEEKLDTNAFTMTPAGASKDSLKVPDKSSI